jgi:hypothetical protein
MISIISAGIKQAFSFYKDRKHLFLGTENKMLLFKNISPELTEKVRQQKRGIFYKNEFSLILILNVMSRCSF